MAENKQVDFNALKGRLEEYTPIPHVTSNFGWVLIAVHQVVGQLVHVIEAQDARIKALEDQAIKMVTPITQGEQRVEKRKVVTRVVDQQGVAHNVESEVDALVIPITGDLKSGETFSVTYTLTENDGGDPK